MTWGRLRCVRLNHDISPTEEPIGDSLCLLTRTWDDLTGSIINWDRTILWNMPEGLKAEVSGMRLMHQPPFRHIHESHNWKSKITIKFSVRNDLFNFPMSWIPEGAYASRAQTACCKRYRITLFGALFYGFPSTFAADYQASPVRRSLIRLPFR